jgi:myo-inositol-1(or 4)-monophosphatase
MNHDELLAVALSAAREAAAYLMQGWRTRPEAESKGGRADLVTVFDKESERIVRARLFKETPYPVVGEELGGQREPGLTWYVDPLDGTTNFVHGHHFFNVSIGLLDGTRPVLGAVVAPALATEWTGIADRASHRNGERCAVSEVARFGDALLATGFPYDRTGPDNNFDAFVAIKKRCQAVRRCGAAAIDMCLVADGTYDGYWERRLKPWDVAAGAAIVLAAGGKLSSYDGGPPDLMSGNMLATNGHIHDALVQHLAEATEEA